MDAETKFENVRMAIKKPFVENSAGMTEKELLALQKYARGTRPDAIASDLGVTRVRVYQLLKKGLRKLSKSLGRKVELADLVNVYLDMIEEAAK